MDHSKFGETGPLHLTLEASGIPQNLHGGLINYITTGRPVGHFLTAVLTNDLKEAIARADFESEESLGRLVRWLYNEAPAPCWGSTAKVIDWMESKRAERERARCEEVSTG